MEKRILATERPDLLLEWDYEKNNGVFDPHKLTVGSGRIVWWKCRTCGCEWQASIVNRAKPNGTGCPACSGHKVLQGFNDLKSQRPDIAAEWNYEKNGDLRPEDIVCGNEKKVWWKCSICGAEYEMDTKHRSLRGQGCPVCNKRGTSFPEQAVFYYLSKVFTDAENKYNHNGFELDIYLPSILTAVEYDGKQWHSRLDRDNRKDEFCKANGIRLIRIRDKSLPKTLFAEHIPCNDNKDSLNSAIKLLIIKLLGDCPIDVDVARDELEIRALLKRYLRDNSLAVKYPEIAKEFAADLNNGITAENVSWSTDGRYWWRCSKCGHVWKATPNHRTSSSSMRGCPRCAIERTGKKNQTKVINLDTGQVFESVTAAAASCGVTKGEITSHCQGKRGLTAGYHWAYYHGDKPRRRDYQGKIINLDTQEVYNSPNEAAESCNGDRRNIVQCCYGKNKTAYGYHWAIYTETE